MIDSLPDPPAPPIDPQASDPGSLPDRATPSESRWARARQRLSEALPVARWRTSVLLAIAVYVLVTGVYFAIAPRALLVEHTPCNHFAHLAEGWLHGRLDLGGAPPAYAQNNDFAHFGKKWFVAFPPFPAVLLLPFVAFAGTAENVRDGQVFLWLAGIGPAVLFLALERLRRLGRSQRSVLVNALFALSFAFGSVYFFTAQQGTVWFAAHVVGVALAAGYLFFALEASFPLLAGLCVGLGALTRSPLLFAVPLFVLEAFRVSVVNGAVPVVTYASRPRFDALRRSVGRVDWLPLVRRLALFGLPIVLCLAFSLWHNQARFGSIYETGYQYLTVAWQARMKKWGLFHFHYLPRNLGVLLTQLPWPELGKWSFRINVHGLALWFTTPVYLWLLWPKRVNAPQVALWITVAAVAVPTLFYQNTGWSQFGYRFSNDYAVFLFALLALGGRRVGLLMSSALLFAVVVNTFGAVTFGRAQFGRFYYSDPSQQKFYQPD